MSERLFPDIGIASLGKQLCHKCGSPDLLKEQWGYLSAKWTCLNPECKAELVTAQPLG